MSHYNFAFYLMAQLIIACLLLLLHPNEGAILPDGSNIICEHFDEKECNESHGCTTTVEHCQVEPDKFPSCYVLWSRDLNDNTKIKMKGCFTDMHECNQTSCVTSAEPRPNNIHFCCCKGSLCNSNHKWVPPPTTEEPTQVPKKKAEENNNWIYYVIGASLFAFLVVVLCIGLFFYRHRKQAHFNEIPMHEAEVTNSSPLLSNRPIQLLEQKASGRFGDVWQAKLHGQDVAVKIFRMQEKESWITENEIYKLPRMRHPNILEFLGTEKHLDKTEYWLISTYQHNGSLCDYLKSHTISWTELCRIAESMANGLAHLHEEIPMSKTEGLKPSIAHRDFKSKNVLLKSDLTACIADFGLAMVFQPGKPCGDTHGQVGTRRYMAPEVLEGAINFNRDAFLRIDIYACALVLWEMVSRCDVVQPVGEYQLPFEAELSQRPTLDEVQESVVMKKLRPHLHDSWRKHPGLLIFCNTMEECWDDDAEARLSSHCVKERFQQLNKYPITQQLIKNHTNIDDAKESTNCL